MERAHDEAMGGEPSLPERPRRRSFTVSYKLAVLEEYEGCTDPGAKGAVLRREGLYSSHIVEWRRARDAGVLAGLAPKPRPKRFTPERAELTLLRRRAERAEAELAKARLVIEIQGKSIRALGEAAGRERRGPEAAAVIDAAFSELSPVVGTRAACAAVGRARATHYRRLKPPLAGPPRPRRSPPNALSEKERQAVVEALHEPRFCDQAPAQVWATLLDEGTYLGSEATMYRELRRRGEVSERRRQATHPPRVVPELVATRPAQVWSYDATTLRGPVRGVHYQLFVMLDIFSRYAPGWLVVDQECAEVVKAWIGQVVAAHGGVQPGSLTIHADRGSAMTSRPVAVLLADLKIGRTHSRPHVSNDNPYSEANFKTLKYCPAFPDRFGSLEDARVFCDTFFEHYNHHHRHSGIGYHTPASVHFGTAAQVRAHRAAILDAAYAAHPERFVNKTPTPPPLPGAA
ncbi:MAG: IS3 family transposase, partial [Actinomycetota bacterium]